MRKHQRIIQKMAQLAYSLSAVLLIIGFIFSLTKPALAALPSPDPQPDDYDGSSLIFESGCSGNCHLITATVRNLGSAMEGPTTYEVWFSVSGNPSQVGTLIYIGVIPPLARNEVFVITYDPTENTNPPYWDTYGNYMFRAIQREGYPGEVDVWSSMCRIITCPTPTNTNTPTATNTATATYTFTPTATNTATPTYTFFCSDQRFNS